MTIHMDVLPVDDEAQALTLMMHHLALAAAYFEATPTTISPLDVLNGVGRHSAPAAEAWLAAMEKLYPQ